MSIKKHRRATSATSAAAAEPQKQQESKGELAAAATAASENLKQTQSRRGAEQDGAPQTTTTDNADAQEKPYRAPLVWTNILLFVALHSALPVGAYMLYTQRPWRTLLWALFGVYASVLGVTAGTHRLWSHKSYKARAPVQVLLMLLQTMAGQNSIYTWSRDHRVHHKYAETEADPHNILRGFFFAHMGWLCCRKHPEVKAKGALIDMSDLEANGIVMFQHRHFWWLATIFTMLLPTLVPILLWNENFWTSFVIGFMWRYIVSLHGTWLVNSAAHYHGDRPYDERIEARESPVVIWTGVGEGFHNYHHTFPFDYSTSEYGAYFNITTAFIDLCAALGLAYDLRKMDAKSVEARRLRTGDQRELMRQGSLTITTGGLQKTIDEADDENEPEDDPEEDDDGIELVARSALVACDAAGRESAAADAADLTAMKFSL